MRCRAPIAAPRVRATPRPRHERQRSPLAPAHRSLPIHLRAFPDGGRPRGCRKHGASSDCLTEGEWRGLDRHPRRRRAGRRLCHQQRALCTHLGDRSNRALARRGSRARQSVLLLRPRRRLTASVPTIYRPWYVESRDVGGRRGSVDHRLARRLRRRILRKRDGRGFRDRRRTGDRGNLGNGRSLGNRGNLGNRRPPRDRRSFRDGRSPGVRRRPCNRRRPFDRRRPCNRWNTGDRWRLCNGRSARAGRYLRDGRRRWRSGRDGGQRRRGRERWTRGLARRRGRPRGSGWRRCSGGNGRHHGLLALSHGRAGRRVLAVG